MPPPSTGGGQPQPSPGIVALPPPKVTRGASARSALNIKWTYPVYTPPKKEASGNTVVKSARTALTREEALAVIAGDDPRPLLVLRECLVCNGTDEALLKSGVDNEKTFLMSTWFHCVKLPADVMEEDHPFHSLFLSEDAPEHLFVSSVDGSNHDPLESQTSRTELWKSMSELLAAEYKKKPETAMKKIARILDKLDGVDEAWNRALNRQEEILEEDGPGSRKLKKLNREIASLEEDRKELLEDIAKAAALELKERERAPQAEAPEESTSKR